MAIIDHQKREVSFKIVYCGPAMSGKTTNLRYIHSRMEKGKRGEMLSMATSTERTIFFDYLPIDAVVIHGFTTKFQLFTVPGQAIYHPSRKLVLRGVDGIVCVADSTPEQAEENVESWRLMEEELAEVGKCASDLPIVIQYNKRDVARALEVAHLDLILMNERVEPVATLEAVAMRGYQVFATLNALAQHLLRAFHASPRSAVAPIETQQPARRPGVPVTMVG